MAIIRYLQTVQLKIRISHMTFAHTSPAVDGVCAVINPVAIPYRHTYMGCNA